jgi:MFS family permease
MPSAHERVVLLIVLVFANAASQGSRYNINFMYYPYLSDELNISFWQYGCLSGIGFTLVSSLCMIPWGRAADLPSFGIRYVLTCGLMLQALFGFLQCLSWNFWSLLVLRSGIAAGQAAIMSPCYAIIGETFKGDSGVANGIFSSGFYVGYGILASLAGVLVALWGLQWTFASFALLCSVAAVACYFAVPSDNGEQGSEQESTFDFRILTSWFLPIEPLLLLCAVALRYFSSVVISSFLPMYFQQYIAADSSEVAEISISYGTVATVAGGASTILGGLLTDSLTRAGLGNAAGWVCCTSSLAASAAVLALLSWPLPPLGVHILLGLLFLATEMWIAPQAIILQVTCSSDDASIEPPSMHRFGGWLRNEPQGRSTSLALPTKPRCK